MTYWMNYRIDYGLARTLSFYRYNYFTNSFRYNIVGKWLKNYDPQCRLKRSPYGWQLYINGTPLHEMKLHHVEYVD